jgi:hypothetical protein
MGSINVIVTPKRGLVQKLTEKAYKLYGVLEVRNILL